MVLYMCVSACPSVGLVCPGGHAYLPHTRGTTHADVRHWWAHPLLRTGTGGPSGRRLILRTAAGLLHRGLGERGGGTSGKDLFFFWVWVGAVGGCVYVRAHMYSKTHACTSQSHLTNPSNKQTNNVTGIHGAHPPPLRCLCTTKREYMSVGETKSVAACCKHRHDTLHWLTDPVHTPPFTLPTIVHRLTDPFVRERTPSKHPSSQQSHLLIDQIPPPSPPPF